MNAIRIRTQPVLLTLLAVLWSAAAAAAPEKRPAPVQHLMDQGFELSERFQAPGGLTGYVGKLGGRPLAFYLTPDKEHVIVGPMLDSEGNNLTKSRIRTRVSGPDNAAAWPRLEKANWVADGAADAERIIYTFTDPNCPYCHRFRKAAEPWIEAGRVQLRHVLVGILKPDSTAMAATILASGDPQAALDRNQANFRDGGIDVDEKLAKQARDRIRANNQLMRDLGLRATPVIYYHTGDGTVARKQGMPRGQGMAAIMGSPEPES